MALYRRGGPVKRGEKSHEALDGKRNQNLPAQNRAASTKATFKSNPHNDGLVS